MNEVSGRFANWVFESGLSDGASETQLMKAVSVDAEILRRGKQRISWNDYISLLENYHDAVGLAKMRESALDFGTTADLRFFGKFAGLFLSPKILYRFMYRWAGNHFLRNVNFNITTRPDGRFLISCKVNEDSRPSEIYFKTLANVIAGAPCRIGRPPAEVEISRMDPHYAEFDIQPPRSASIGWYLKWPFRAIAAIPAFTNIFARQQEEIKETHTAFEQQQRDYRAVVDQISDLLLILNEQGQVLFANDIAHQQFDRKESAGQLWSPRDFLGPKSQQSWTEFMAEDSPAELEFCFHVPSNGASRELWLAFSAPQRTTFGEDKALMLLGRDVTESRQVEARMREAAFEERRRIADDLHDGLGQILTGINWQANLLASQLEKGPDPDPTKADAARSIANLATTSTQQARDLAHGLAGMDESPDNLRRALTEHARKIEQEFHLPVKLTLPTGDTPLSAPGHAALEVLRIVQEASHNAFKHAEASCLMLTVEIKADRWHVEVSDDGTGLGADSAQASSGLGIRSMQRRASTLGGTIELFDRASPETGTTLRLSLPPQELTTVSKLPPPDSPPTPEEATAPESESIRVMVADDHDTVRKGIVALLSEESGITVCCETGKRSEIVSTAMEFKPDVAIIDMLMDGDDNLDTIQELRSVAPTLRIAVLSMFHEEQYGDSARTAGADSYIMKQSSPEDLVAFVRTKTPATPISLVVNK